MHGLVGLLGQMAPPRHAPPHLSVDTTKTQPTYPYTTTTTPHGCHHAFRVTPARGSDLVWCSSLFYILTSDDDVFPLYLAAIV